MILLILLILLVAGAAVFLLKKKKVKNSDAPVVPVNPVIPADPNNGYEYHGYSKPTQGKEWFP